MSYLKRYLRHYRLESILAPLFKMLEACFDLFVPLVVAYMIDSGIASGNRGIVYRCTALLIVLAIVGLVCSFVAQYFAAKSATGVSARMRHDLFAHIQSLNASEIDKIGTSTLITRMTSDINQVQNGLNLFLRLFMRSPFIVVGAMVMAFTVHARAALIFLAVIPVLSVVVFGIMRWTSPRYKEIQGKLDLVTRATRENLSGVRVVRAFGREAEETQQFRETNDALMRSQLFVGKVSALMNPVTYVIVNLGIIGILYIGSRNAESGTMLSGDVIALVNYMSQILVELLKFANFIVTTSRALASLGRVSGVLDVKPSMEFSGKTESSSDADEAVRFENVSLRYKGAGEESLSNISFTAKKGETIGIIGGTGSGKTSLVNLINRMYDPTSGEVYIGAVPAKQWEKTALRRAVSTVMQKAQLFKGTVRSNLLWGKADATESEIWQALQFAQAEDFVKTIPEGLDAPVEQSGRNLSGGQKQRLTIARALIAKPQILILDDSASALDFATDAALRQALRHLPFPVTAFIVSQRTSSIRHADKILVLDDGLLMDCGTHEELLERCAVYKEIHDSQFRKEGAAR